MIPSIFLFFFSLISMSRKIMKIEIRILNQIKLLLPFLIAFSNQNVHCGSESNFSVDYGL